jgi:isopropylmalate/homocitrate/citramalate synthase
LDLRPRLIGHARLDRDEIRMVSDLGLPWVGLFSGISALSLKRYGMSKQAVYDRAGEAVRYAKELGLRVKYTCEDASRTDIYDVVAFYAYLHALGVDRLSYADTLGILTPRAVEQLRAEIEKRMPFNVLHFHFHNDFGRALDNAVAAAECGARCIDASILGIGERMGLAPLEKLLVFLHGENSKEYKIAVLREAADLVRSCINQEHYKYRRFAHKSGIHINGMIKDPAIYEPVDPDNAGSKRILVLSKLIGRSGLRKILSLHGFYSHEEELASFLQEIKSEDMLELAEPDEINRYFAERGLERQGVKG